MQINVEKVIDGLSQKIGVLEKDNTILQVQIEMLMDKIRSLESQEQTDNERE